MTSIDWHALLNDADALRASGWFLAEGRLVLEQLCSGAAGGPDAIVSVLATPAAAQALALEARVGDRLDIRSAREMEAVTGFNFHRGVLALVRRPPTLAVNDLLAKVVHAEVYPASHDRRARGTATPVRGASATPGGSEAEGRRPNDDGRPVLVVLEHLVDVDNVGSCFRNARAFGVSGVLVDQRCADPLYRKAIRTSQGATLVVPWATGPVPEVLAALAERGVTTVGLTPQGSAGGRAVPTLADVDAALDARTPIAVIVGNEGGGLSAATLASCTHLARIPMAAGADSINVATALAVTLYRFTEGSGLR